MKTIVCFTLLVLVGVAQSMGQVVVAPTAVLVSSGNPVGTFIVQNPSNESREVRLSLRFGYEKVGTEGKRVLDYSDSMAVRHYGLDSYTKLFPQRFVLQPGAEQEVRVIVKQPQGNGEKVLWTRLITESTQQMQMQSAPASGISAQLNVVIRQIIPVIYFNGHGQTSLQFGEAGFSEPQGGEDRGMLNINLQRTGEVPFIGSVEMRVTDQNGQEVERLKRPASVYFTSIESLPVSCKKYAPGKYKAEVTFTSERDGVPASLLPSIPETHTSVEFEIH